MWLRRLDTEYSTGRRLSQDLFSQGFHPYGLLAYPRPLSWFVFIGGRLKRGGIGFADFIPPPPLGGRVIPGGKFAPYPSDAPTFQSPE